MRRLGSALIVLAFLAFPASTADHSPVGDAGMGVDAPEEPVPVIEVWPRTSYSGVVASGLDDEDWFAVGGVGAGDRLLFTILGHAPCPTLTDSTGTPLPEQLCSLIPTGELRLRATVQDDGYQYLRVTSGTGARYSFAYDVDWWAASPDPARDVAGRRAGWATAPDLAESCRSWDASEGASTFGAGDAAIPDLTWAALKTGFRLALTWSSEEAAVPSVDLATPDGQAYRVATAGAPGTRHVVVLDDVPEGGVVCFRVRHEGAGGVTESAWHAVLARNAMTAFDPVEGTYTMNLLAYVEQAATDRAELELAFHSFARKLWDATDGHVRAGAIILVAGDAREHNSGFFSCELSHLAVDLTTPTCHRQFDVVFSHDGLPNAAAHTSPDGIKRPFDTMTMINTWERPGMGLGTWEHEVSSVLLHEVGHYAFGAQDLYVAGNCYDTRFDISVMGSSRDATEFDDEFARCPNEHRLPGYVPSWTLLRERFPEVPERPAGPAPGPEGDGGAFVLRVVGLPVASGEPVNG